MLPTLFIIGLIFAPIGALIIWGSGKVTNFTLDYTECDAQPSDGSWNVMPSDKYGCESPGGVGRVGHDESWTVAEETRLRRGRTVLTQRRAQDGL